MFIRRKPRRSKRGITFDFYVVRSLRSENGPRQKVCGYLGCIEDRFLDDPFHCGIFWQSRRMADGSYRKGAKELIEEIVAAENPRERCQEVTKLIKMAERYIPELPGDAYQHTTATIRYSARRKVSRCAKS
jgi:hypothetical protein